jgi:hypothetical protein
MRLVKEIVPRVFHLFQEYGYNVVKGRPWATYEIEEKNMMVQTIIMRSWIFAPIIFPFEIPKIYVVS